MKTFVGLFEQLQIQTDGIGGSAGWDAVNVAQDVSVEMSHAEADATTRGSAGYENTEPGRRKMDFSFSVVYDPDDAQYAALQAAFIARSAIGMRALDASDGEGPQADVKIFGFTHAQNMDGVHVVNVTAKPCRSASAPSWYVPTP